MEPHVSIIIVHYGSLGHTRKVLSDLSKFSDPPAREIIVVDNASSQVFPAQEFPEVHTLRLEQNRGYGHACNRGADVAKGRTLFILNDDLEFPENPLPALLEELRTTPHCGAVGPVLRFPDGRYQLSWSDDPTLLAEFFERQRQQGRRSGSGDLRRPRGAASSDSWTVDWITGACMLISREAWESVGGFDEAYFFYFEDADLCMRLRSAGFVIRCCSRAEVIHYGGRSEPMSDPEIVVSYRREQLRYYARYNSQLSFSLLKRYLLRKFMRLERSGAMSAALAAQVRETIRTFSRTRERERFHATHGKKS